MTDRVGGCGHDLTGANVMIFMGSLYSGPYEEQAIGTKLPVSSEVINCSENLQT
jgi:hypothetical protein